MPPPKPAIRLHRQWAPLDKGAQPVFEQFHTGYLVVPLGSCTWERGMRFVWFKFYQFIPPCPWTNSLLCLHWLMMLLFTQVRFYSTSQQATLSWVIQRGNTFQSSTDSAGFHRNPGIDRNSGIPVESVGIRRNPSESAGIYLWYIIKDLIKSVHIL